MNLLILFSFFLVIFVFKLVYFKIADRYNIIDHPNHRSSHTKVTIRGGGVVFPVGFLLASVYFGGEYLYFLLGFCQSHNCYFVQILCSVSIIFSSVAFGFFFKVYFSLLDVCPPFLFVGFSRTPPTYNKGHRKKFALY